MSLIVCQLLMSFSIICTSTSSVEAGLRNAARIDNIGKKVKVELRVFSGRENPNWLLSKEQADALVAIIDELPTSDPESFYDGLGYRGFLVTITTPSGEPATVTVYKGTVQYSTKGGIKYLTDEQRQVEKLLLESGASRLDKNIYNMVQREIASPKERTSSN